MITFAENCLRGSQCDWMWVAFNLEEINVNTPELVVSVYAMNEHPFWAIQFCFDFGDMLYTQFCFLQNFLGTVYYFTLC